MFVLIKNGQVAQFPYNISKYRADNPNVSLPADPSLQQLNEVGLYSVTQTGAPSTSIDKVAVDGGVTLIDGNWTQQWTLRDATQLEQVSNTIAVQSIIVEQTQQRLDDFAKTRNYDSILSACTYATSTIPKFASEGQYAVNARDNTWATLYIIMGEVQAGTRPMPTSFADVEPLLPVLTWPT